MSQVIVGHWFIDVFVEELDDDPKHQRPWWRKEFSAVKCVDTEGVTDVATLRRFRI